MKKGQAQTSLVSLKYDKILLRMADLLDISEQRVSLPILRHNLKNMSPNSAFHWLSHLLTEGYALGVEFDLNEKHKECNEKYSLIKAKLIMTVNVTLLQFSQVEKTPCPQCAMIEPPSKEGFTLNMTETTCGYEKCPFVCRWFEKKQLFD